MILCMSRWSVVSHGHSYQLMSKTKHLRHLKRDSLNVSKCLVLFVFPSPCFLCFRFPFLVFLVGVGIRSVNSLITRLKFLINHLWYPTNPMNLSTSSGVWGFGQFITLYRYWICQLLITIRASHIRLWRCIRTIRIEQGREKLPTTQERVSSTEMVHLRQI